MESPRTRVVVRPCRRAVCHTIEKVVAMIPNRNDLSEERLRMTILQQLRSPVSARTPKKVKTDAVFVQVRFPRIDFTSNLTHRRHAFSPTHTHPHENTSWLHPKPLLRFPPCRPRTIYYRIKKVFREFEEIFFQPSVEAHQGYHGNRIPATLTWRDITRNSESFQEAFRGKACTSL